MVKWQYDGSIRPRWADAPQAGQESVWDYPRPPVIVADSRSVTVSTSASAIARTSRAKRVCETAGPPTWYLPQTDVDMAQLQVLAGTSVCEWKGGARYYSLHGETRAVAWDYPAPNTAYRLLTDHIAFYPGRVVCIVDGERVRAQDGDFYGGWVTDDIAGPWKGPPGTAHW